MNETNNTKPRTANRVDSMMIYNGWLADGINVQLKKRVALANSKGWKVHQVTEIKGQFGFLLSFLSFVLSIVTLGAFSFGGMLIVIYERDDSYVKQKGISNNPHTDTKE